MQPFDPVFETMAFVPFPRQSLCVTRNSSFDGGLQLVRSIVRIFGRFPISVARRGSRPFPGWESQDAHDGKRPPLRLSPCWWTDMWIGMAQVLPTHPSNLHARRLRENPSEFLPQEDSIRLTSHEEEDSPPRRMLVSSSLSLFEPQRHQPSFGCIWNQPEVYGKGLGMVVPSSTVHVQRVHVIAPTNPHPTSPPPTSQTFLKEGITIDERGCFQTRVMAFGIREGTLSLGPSYRLRSSSLQFRCTRATSHASFDKHSVSRLEQRRWKWHLSPPV